MFYASVLALLGGMLYRFDPTTMAFQPKQGAAYFPSVIELLISMAFMAMGIAIFIFLAKVLAILPAPNSMARTMEAQRTKTPVIRRLPAALGGGHYVAGD
jgi:Ni/Fe-hydrogenase subunit HybB-like protein